MTARAELIEKYLQNRLTEEEKAEFDSLLESDAVFNEEVEFHKNLKWVVTTEDRDNFRNRISRIEATPRVKRSYTRWLVAAAITVLLGLGYWLSLSNQVGTDKLFEQYFEPYRNIIAPIERDDSERTAKETAFEAYEQKKYPLAIEKFSELYETTNKPYYLFYKANSLLSVNQATEAIPLLIEYNETGDSLREVASWYLALAYLQSEEVEKAKKTLQEVVSQNSFKTAEAKELLEHINESLSKPKD